MIGVLLCPVGTITSAKLSSTTNAYSQRLPLGLFQVTRHHNRAEGRL
jgi:hypothetical protein